MTKITPAEQSYMNRIRKHINELREFLNSSDVTDQSSIDDWFAYVAKIRAIQGNSSNDSSFLACLMAKQYLAQRFDLRYFDAAAKAQGAPGLDIDERLPNGERLIAEIKTTVPYSGARNDLGAQQKSSFQKDFVKLNAEKAQHKYFFVTDQQTYDVVMKRYAAQIPGVEIVLLTDLNEELE